MTTLDVKTQLFGTAAQWQSGLLVKLQSLETGGIALFPSPSFQRWVMALPAGTGSPYSLTVDECRQLYWIDPDDGWLYRFLPGNRQPERLLPMADYLAEPGAAGRMILQQSTLWILDRYRKRVLAFSREYFQLRYVLESPAVIDMAFDGDERLYLLEQKTESHQHRPDKFCISRYDADGRRLGEPFGQRQFRAPTGLVVSRQGNVYVIDKDAQDNVGFHRFGADGGHQWLVFAAELQRFEPVLIAIDTKDNIFIVATLKQTLPSEPDDPSPLHQLSPDGSYLGQVTLPNTIQTITAVSTGPGNALYLASEQGIAYLDLNTQLIGQSGSYYSKTLDNGENKGSWHRLMLQAGLPPGTDLEVQYYVSDDEGLKTAIDAALADSTLSLQAKEQKIQRWLGPRWSRPEVFKTTAEAEITGIGETAATTIGGQKQDYSANQHLLFQENNGRFLWLKLKLSTFDEGNKPVITSMQVYYPRVSYLRYLPAIYQEDVVKRAFLEKFLALYETVLYGLEDEIRHIFRYFDPSSAPQEFLAWLSGWLNFALQEDWPEARKRRFLLRANILFTRKGTPAGISEFIEIYSGQRPRLLEHGRQAKPMVLAHAPAELGERPFRLGLDSIVRRTPLRGFRLGDDAILGYSALREVVQQPEEPFLQTAHRFTVLLALTAQELGRLETGLRRILREQSPAHTQYDLRLLEGGFDSAGGGYLGINTRVTDYKPLRLGVDAALGKVVLLIHKAEGVLLERNSRLTGGIRLI